jgi:hypothetical protein
MAASAATSNLRLALRKTMKKTPFLFHPMVYSLSLQEKLDLDQGKEFPLTPPQRKRMGVVAPRLFCWSLRVAGWLITSPINEITRLHRDFKLHSA